MKESFYWKIGFILLISFSLVFIGVVFAKEDSFKKVDTTTVWVKPIDSVQPTLMVEKSSQSAIPTKEELDIAYNKYKELNK